MDKKSKILNLELLKTKLSKLLCKIGLHKWKWILPKGITFSLLYDRECTRCLKKEKKNIKPSIATKLYRESRRKTQNEIYSCDKARKKIVDIPKEYLVSKIGKEQTETLMEIRKTANAKRYKQEQECFKYINPEKAKEIMAEYEANMIRIKEIKENNIFYKNELKRMKKKNVCINK